MWTKQNSGGTPIKNTEQFNKDWSKNPQYLLELREDADLFISLGQPDGRLIPGCSYPFPEEIHHVMFTIWKVDDKEPLTKYDRKKKPMKSIIKEYRELSLFIDSSVVAAVRKEWASTEFRRCSDDSVYCAKGHRC